MKYTVVLLYPLDAVSRIEGLETYLAHVEADTPDKAERAAQVQALRAQSYTKGWKAGWFKVSAVFEGHLTDVKRSVRC